MDSGPAKIHKVGHFGYMTHNYTETVAWYTSRFNFKPTDIVHKPGAPNDELMSFFHLDLGAEYSDHHCLLIARHHGTGQGTKVHHSSFEVEDLDTQMMGHKWLGERGYRLMWGVGRHIMGSQIFDYWWDTSGFVIEHYADSDVVNEDTPTVKSASTAAAIWGPPVPTKWD
jgi:catechol 2,3-dioxygenase-like lactoylglutathione lyase family enzyme